MRRRSVVRVLTRDGRNLELLALALRRGAFALLTWRLQPLARSMLTLAG